MTFLYLLVLLLFCTFCASADENDHDALAVEEENKLNIIDLGFDMQFLIFREFELKDLYQIANTHPNFREVTADLFRRRYGHSTVDIRETHSIFREALFDRKKLDSGKIEIHLIESALKVLKYFGCVIQKINIENDKIIANESNVISQHINKYGSESLVHIDFGQIKEDTFEQFTKPMNKVEDLTMKIGKVSEIRMGNLTFNRIFPKLRRLNLKLEADIDHSFLDCEFQHLEDLVVDVSPASSKHGDPIEGLLKHNPQIRSISTFNVPRDYVKIINKWIPNLERVSLQSLHLGNDIVRMKNIKEISFSVVDSIKNLFLPSVETIVMNYSPNEFDEWKEFFKNHQTVTYLEARRINSLNFDLIGLFTSLPELSILSLESTTKVGDDFGEAIIEFLQNHKRLMKFQFLIYLYSKDEVDAIIERFQNEWFIYQITEIRNVGMMRGITMQRKNNSPESV